MDDIASAVIDKTEQKLDKADEKKKTSVGGFFLRFIVSIIWFIVAAVASIGGAVAMVSGDVASVFGNGDATTLYIIGIGACLAVFLITFLVPYLRKGSFTRWMGIVCLGDALWWIYLLISNQ